MSKAHRSLYHSTLGLRVLKQRRRRLSEPLAPVTTQEQFDRLFSNTKVKQTTSWSESTLAS